MKAKWSLLLALVSILTACGPVVPIEASTSKADPSWPGMKPGWSTFWAPPNMNNPFYDPAGYIWVLNKRSVYRWEIASGKMDLLTVENGLPAGIKALTAFEGKVWAATQDGNVAAYDGKQWKTEKIIDKSMYKFYQTPGRLWVSSSQCSERHLFFYENGTWKEFKNLPKDFIPENMARSKDGKLWFQSWATTWSFDSQNWKEYKNMVGARQIFSTSDGIVYFVLDRIILRSDGETFTPIALSGDNYSYYTGEALQTPEGDILVVASYDDKAATLIHRDGSTSSVPSPRSGLQNNRNRYFTTKLITPQGILLTNTKQIALSYQGKMQIFEVEKDTFTKLIDNYRIIGFAPDGALWAQSNDEHHLITRYNGQELEEPFGELPDDFNVRSTKFNARGELWGFNYKGDLTKLVPGEKPIRYKVHFIINQLEFAPDGSIWLLGNDEFLAHIHPQDLQQGKVTNPEIIRVGEGLTERTLRPSNMKIGPKGEVWVYVAEDGFYRYNGYEWQADDGSIRPINHSAFAIDLKGKLWAGIDHHLYKYDGKSWTDFPRNCIFPSEMTVARDGTIWFINGCDGVYSFDEKEWTHFTREKELAGTVPEQILVAPDGALWFISYEAWIRYEP